MKIGKTKDGQVWMALETNVQGKLAQIMLTWTPNDALKIADSLKKAAGWAKEENKIVIPRMGLG